PPTTAIVQIAAIPVLALALRRLAHRTASPEALWPTAVFGCAVALVMAQLVPLPVSLWTRLPGHAAALQGYRAAGMAPPPLPLSLAPSGTFDSLFGFLPPAAMFLSVLGADARGRRILAATVLVVALAAVIAGMMQIA